MNTFANSRALKAAPRIAPMSGGRPGTYRFEANVSIAGHWQWSLGAKVQGETDTVEDKLTIQAST